MPPPTWWARIVWIATKSPTMGSEDFSFMMEQVPGAYILVGNGEGAPAHHPRYNFNDEAIAVRRGAVRAVGREEAAEGFLTGALA